MSGERRYFPWRKPKKEIPTEPPKASLDQGWIEPDWSISPDAMSVSFNEKPPKIELSEQQRAREKLAAERDAIRFRR